MFKGIMGVILAVTDSRQGSGRSRHCNQGPPFPPPATPREAIVFERCPNLLSRLGAPLLLTRTAGTPHQADNTDTVGSPYSKPRLERGFL
jgi:hypothetical protein